MISDRGEGPSIFLFDVVRSSFTVFRHNGMEWNGMERKLENCSRL